MGQYVVNKTVRIKATPEEVWDALTNPDKTKHYFFHCEVISDWQVGSDITFKGKIFLLIPIEMHGKILAIEPARLLKYTLKNGKDDDAKASFSTVTDTLSYEEGATVLHISDDVGDGEDTEKRYERSVKGWNDVLNGLKKLLEETE